MLCWNILADEDSFFQQSIQVWEIIDITRDSILGLAREADPVEEIITVWASVRDRMS